MGKFWPLLAGLGILVALALFLRARNPGSSPRPASSIPTSPNPAGLPRTEERPGLPRPESPVPAQSDIPAQKGKVRVTVQTPDGDFAGVVGLVRGDGRSVDQQPIAGEGRGSILFENLESGDYRAFFVPSRNHAPASAEVRVALGSETSVVLSLRSAGVLRGMAVDALLRPLAKVRLGVDLPSAFPALEGGARVLLSGGGGRASSAPGGIRSGTWSFAVSSTGSLRLHAITGPDGTFTIGGLPGSAVAVEVSFDPVRFSQSCRVGPEATIVVPVQPLPQAADPDLQEYRRAADVLLARMIENPETEEAYWTQLKALIEAWIARPNFPASDRGAVQDSIRKTEELRSRSRKPP